SDGWVVCPALSLERQRRAIPTQVGIALLVLRPCRGEESRARFAIVRVAILSLHRKTSLSFQFRVSSSRSACFPATRSFTLETRKLFNPPVPSPDCPPLRAEAE